MGALGCVPAYDRYVVESIKEAGLVAFPLGKDDNFELIQQSISNISKFYFDNALIFQQVTMKPQGFYYPPMKIMDMVLWKMSFRKSAAQKILSMPSPQNKGNAKAWRSAEEDKAMSDWLQGSGSDYSECFDKNGVLKQIRKKKRHSKKRAKRNPKKNYQELFESFADSLYEPQEKILLNTVPDEE
jgi:hypothetical protein